ncbi:FAD-binding domain-containing protein, partial [Setomelanomma holmii]
DPTTVCNQLKKQFANITYLPTDAGYVNETQGTRIPWAAIAWLDPACVSAPRNAVDLSHAVKLFKKSSTLFAVRGGGHMPIPDAANINSTGVQTSSSNLKTLELSEYKQTMSIGPGPRWDDVFEYMDGTNLTILVADCPPVGIPGLLLGGGIRYRSNAHGMSASEGKIKAYECVLADGTIATVTAKSHPDLYWALQGGGNSFALVTRFDPLTFPLCARAPPPTTGPLATFYNGTIESVNSSSTLHPLSLAQYAKLLHPAFENGGPGHGFHQKLRVVSMKATREAMDIVHDACFAKLRSTNIANRVPGSFAGLAYDSITRTFAERSQGTPMGVEPIPQFWVEEATSWDYAADDAEVYTFLSEVNAEIEGRLEEKNLTLPYVYLNDADKGQKVSESYGKGNVARLRAIRKKYDPAGVFTVLMPGGWKV